MHTSFLTKNWTKQKKEMKTNKNKDPKPGSFLLKLMKQKFIITLCGSLKFQYVFNDVQMRLERDGHCCFSVGFSESNYTPPTDTEKKVLDKVHYRKISLSDLVLVIDVDGYIGESTTEEIRFAVVNNKWVGYLSLTNYFINKGELIKYFRSKTIQDLLNR